MPSPDTGISQSAPFTPGKSVSLVLVLEFTDNVLCSAAHRVRPGELWEAEGRWPGSTDLCLSGTPIAEQS